MDADSSSKFIGSLTKFLQSLCNGYVEFQRGVELVGHIYLSIDTGEKVDYVLHEKVSKSDESSVTFVSNSFHALPPDKLDKNKSKDTSKQGNANINNAVIGAKGAGNSSDDDDLVIIESGSKDILGSTNSGTIPSRKRKASPSSDHHIQKVVKPLAGKSAVGQGVATNTRQQTGGPSATVSSQEGLNVGDMKLEQITSDELLSLASQVGEGHSRTSMPRSQGHRSGGSGDASGWIKQEALEDGDSDTGWSQGRDESNSNSGSNLYPVMLHQNTSAYSNPVFPGFSPHTGAPSSFANPVPGTSQDLGGIDASATELSLDQQRLETSSSTLTSSLSSTGNKVTVHISTNTREKRIYDKINCCLFCLKLSTNLTKHILSTHKNETDVQLILSKPKFSKERTLLLQKIRNHGNYKHNCNVIKRGNGELIPVRSPSEGMDPSDYIPCEFCLGFFFKRELWRHSQECVFGISTQKGRKLIS